MGCKTSAREMAWQHAIKIVTDALYVVKGFIPYNRAAYKRGTNGDIWCEIYDIMDKMSIWPTIHKVKSHLTVEELIAFYRSNDDIARWAISNEAADGAAGAEADHQGGHDNELMKQDYMHAQLWRVLKRASAIEMDIRLHDEGVPITAESIIASVEAVAEERCMKEEERFKRCIEK